MNGGGRYVWTAGAFYYAGQAIAGFSVVGIAIGIVLMALISMIIDVLISVNTPRDRTTYGR